MCTVIGLMPVSVQILDKRKKWLKTHKYLCSSIITEVNCFVFGWYDAHNSL